MSRQRTGTKPEIDDISKILRIGTGTEKYSKIGEKIYKIA